MNRNEQDNKPERTAMEETREPIVTEFTPARKSGRAFNGFHRDAGRITHLLPGSYDASEYNLWRKALCGTEPGIRGNGWQVWPDGKKSEANCPRCIKKYNEKYPNHGK